MIFRNARMIPKDAGSTFEQATNIANRKGVWMLEYLRARREVSDVTQPDYRREMAMRAKGGFRSKHITLRPKQKAPAD